MTVRAGLTGALALFAAAGFATIAEAAPKPAKPPVVKLEGCARITPVACKKLGSYVINNARPNVPLGTYVRLTGVVGGQSGICFAAYLTEIKWQPVKGKVCK